MKKLLIPILLIAVCLAPLSSYGAEKVRFVHALTVYADEKGASLNGPEGVACREGTIVVADTANGRLLLYKLANSELSGGKEIKVSQVAAPIRVHVNSRGEILALDGKTRQLARFGPEGKLIGFVEPAGLPDAGSMLLRSFALDRTDNLYLLDVFGARVIVLDAAGKYQRQIPLPPQGGFFSDLAVGPQGTLYLLDSVSAVLYAAAPGGGEFNKLAANLGEYLNFPTAVTADAQGALYLVDRNGSGIVVLGPDGSYRGRHLTMGWKPGLLYYPSQLCLTGEDEAIIADRNNNRMQIFKLVR